MKTLIYALLICSGGNCVTPGGQLPYVFQTQAQCEHNAELMNRGYRTMEGNGPNVPGRWYAACFSREYPVWEPVVRTPQIQEEDQSGPSNEEAARLVDETEYQKYLRALDEYKTRKGIR